MPFSDSNGHLLKYANAFIEKDWNKIMILAFYTKACKMGQTLDSAALQFNALLKGMRDHYTSSGEVHPEPVFAVDNPVVVALGLITEFSVDEVRTLIASTAQGTADNGAHLADSVADAKLKALARPTKPKTTAYTSFTEAAEDLADLLNKNLRGGIELRGQSLNTSHLGYGGTRGQRSGWKNNDTFTQALPEVWSQVEASVRVLVGTLQIVHFTPRQI